MTAGVRSTARAWCLAALAAVLLACPLRAAASQLGISNEQFLSIMRNTSFQPGDAMLFLEQNPPGLETMDLPPQGEPAVKAIVYRRISAEKYRIVIRGARGAFPLLFGEAFHHQWKLYPVTPPAQPPESLPGRLAAIPQAPDAPSRATADQLAALVAAGIVRDLGRDAAPAYVSRLIRRTVQNDNLEAGSCLETRSLPFLDEQGHLVANGYANLWIIDPARVRDLNPGAVVDNADGTVDMAFVLEFRQRYARVWGVAVSLATLAATLLFLLARALRRSRRAKAA